MPVRSIRQAAPTTTFADSSSETAIAVVEDFGTRYTVLCRIAFDGVEYVGRLWFAEPGKTEAAIPDRANIPGRTREDVLALARRLTTNELALRQRRAFSERRQYIRLRRLTDEIIQKIRYLNHVAIMMHGGVLAEESAQHEFDITERQLHDCVDRLRDAAGVVG